MRPLRMPLHIPSGEVTAGRTRLSARCDDELTLIPVA